jgi:hypothetical protein
MLFKAMAAAMFQTEQLVAGGGVDREQISNLRPLA